MSTNIKITIAESSSIIRCGLETLLKRLPGFRIQISEITAADCLTEGLRIYKPDILIVNPSIPGNFNLQHLKDECGCPDMKCFALQYNVSDPFLLRSYDDQISIYDNADELKNKLERLNTEEVPSEEGENEDQQTLSSRVKRDCHLCGKRHDKPRDCRQVIPIHPHRYYPPPEHRPKIASTQCQRLDCLCHRKQIDRVERLERLTNSTVPCFIK